MTSKIIVGHTFLESEKITQFPSSTFTSYILITFPDKKKEEKLSSVTPHHTKEFKVQTETTVLIDNNTITVLLNNFDKQRVTSKTCFLGAG